MWSQNTAADGSGIVLLSEVKEEWMLVMLSSLSRGSVVSAMGKAGSGVGWYPGYTRRSRGCGRDHTVTSGWCQVPHFGVLARVLWHGLHPQVVVVRVKHG